MARNFTNDVLSDLTFENVNNVETVGEPLPKIENVKTFDRKGKDVITGYEDEPEVSFCVNMSLEGKMFITTESRRLGMKIKEYLTKIIEEDNDSEPLSRNESFQICKKCKLEDKRVSRYTLPQSIVEMFENNARKNMMNKTEYIYYLMSKML